jgi:integrase
MPKILRRPSKLPPEQRERAQQLAARWRELHTWTPNQLQHHRATLLHREFGIEEAQIILGHSDPKTTLIYAEADVAKAKEIMARIG